MPLPPRLRPLGKRALGLCTLAALAGPLSTPRVARAGEGPYSLAEQIGRVLSRIEAEYVDPVDRQRLLEGAAKGMVGELDPHCGYLPPEEYRILLADTEGTFGGIGVEVDFRGDAVIVIAPIEGSPAALLGVRPGDRIEAIDGEPIAGRQATDIIRRMRGREGTRVEVTLRRPGEAAPRRLVLERKVIHVASVASTLLDGGVAYLRVKQFQAGTHAELLAAVAELRKRAAGSGGIASVLLDLRSNPGGLVDEASAVADELLGKGVIYTTRRRGRTVDEVRSADGGALAREPLVVLVNAWSASAAELVAGAVRDHKRGRIIGTPTFGKGSVQSIVDLPGGAGLRLTTLRYFTPHGHAIQSRGIVPDLVVSEVLGAEADARRERDLEGHLAAEGDLVDPADARRTGPPPPGEPLRVPLPVTEIPADPSKAPDPALATGYRLLRGESPPRR